mmetsp:Transcript_15170/g.32373  ORF Transcript_15170/g.32373 Transcript_15170/m.32373 type:complete len:562 (-) Transcript_15170:33-1718(-)
MYVIRGSILLLMASTTTAFVSQCSVRFGALGRSRILANSRNVAPKFAWRAQSTSNVIQSPINPSVSSKGDTETVDALVIGSGISGSTLGFSLFQRGVNVLVTEARDVVGGNVISRKQDGFQWEEGPNTFQPTQQIMRLAVDLGLKDQLVFADHTLPRMVYWDSKLFPLPSALEDAPFFALLNPLEKLRAGLGAIGLLSGRPAGVEESVKDFIERTLGEAVFKKIIDPFVSGVYAGDPSKLSMASAFRKIYSLEDLAPARGLVWGGLLRQMERAREARENFDPELPTYVGGALGSFREGLQQLPNTVLARLGADRVRTGWKVESLSRNADGTYTARFATPEGERSVVARTVSITAPALATHEVLKDLVPETRRLTEIEYPCVYSVTLAYPADAFADGTRREREGLSGRRLFGFGNLIPRSMGIRTLGTIWSSSLFPYRVPEGYEMVLSYIGGAQDPLRYTPPIAELSDAEVVDAVHGDVSRILLKPGAPAPRVLGVRKWARAIPQYNKGYAAIRAEVDAGLARCPGLFLGGNYVSGVAFGDCVQWGVDTAPKVQQLLATLPK